MNTPICDFVNQYKKSNPLRFHMPGHKGLNFLGVEDIDITEINGADSLYEASGIIKESEENAGRLFGCKTFYSAEGSSLCIKAMLYLTVLYAKQKCRKPLIWAGRNVHKSFLHAAALLDFETEWLYSKKKSSYLSCVIDADFLQKAFDEAEELPVAVYITSPDYLGSITDIKSISDVCKKHGVLLIVDNAHGAYLRFLPSSLHPIDMGADICCDSAHKTLPVLTGGAYLNISDSAPDLFSVEAKNALSLFGSTSPSYTILQSLDYANKYISEGYCEKLSSFADEVNGLKELLTEHGFELYGNEPIKLTVKTKPYGYTGIDFADILLKNKIVCEFADPDFIVFMLTPENGSDSLSVLKKALLSIEKKAKIEDAPPESGIAEKAVSIREAVFSENEIIPVSESIGRILASPCVACPPAVPIVVCGEIIDKNAAECFKYYGTEECTVIK